MEYVTLDSDDEDTIVPPSPSQSIVTVPVNDTGAGFRSRSNFIPGGAMRGARGAMRGAGGAMRDLAKSGGAMAPSQSNATVPVNDTEKGLPSRSNVIPGDALRDLAKSGGAMKPSQSNVTVPVNDTGAGLQSRLSVIPGGAMRDLAKSGGATAPSQSNVTVPINDNLPLAELRRRSKVVPGGAMAPPDFARSVKVNHASTKPRILSPPNKTGTPGVSDLPTALGKTYLMRKRARK